MSWDVWVEPYRASGAWVRPDVEWNYTSNMVPMVRRAGMKSMTELDGLTGDEAAARVRDLISAMQRDESGYTEVEPANGWGSYPSFLADLHRLHVDLCAHGPGRVRCTA